MSLVDDEGVDLVFHRRGGVATLAIQVKSRSTRASAVRRGRFQAVVRQQTFHPRRDLYLLFVAVDEDDASHAEGVVLDGRHRLEVARELGFARVPVRVVAPSDEVEHMVRAALARRHLNASQRGALAVDLEAFQDDRQSARKRQLANLRQFADVATLPSRGERTRETAARWAGVSPRVVQDALTVRDADPALYERVRAGEVPVHTAARRVRRARRYAQIPPAAPLPSGPFELILADPPWQMGNPDAPSSLEKHYPTMPLEEIQGLEVPAADDAVLFLWAVNSLLPEALAVMEAWGFTYKANLVWVKPWIGPGGLLRQRHELLLLGTRGHPAPPEPQDRPDSVIEAPRGRHSEKPKGLYERIERAYPHATKCELFARGVPRAGWVAWGNEVIAA